MTNILLKVNGASAVASADGKITSGMVGLPVSIEFDDSWNGLSKTAFFRVGGQVRKRDSIGTSTTVPWEILRNHGKPLEIGIEGRDNDGNIVVPTIWASVAMVYQGANGEIPAAPNPDSGDSPSGGGITKEQFNELLEQAITTPVEEGGMRETLASSVIESDDFYASVSSNLYWELETIAASEPDSEEYRLFAEAVLAVLPIYEGEG